MKNPNTGFEKYSKFFFFLSFFFFFLGGGVVGEGRAKEGGQRRGSGHGEG